MGVQYLSSVLQRARRLINSVFEAVYAAQLRAGEVELYGKPVDKIDPTSGQAALIPKNWTVHNWSFPR